MVGKRDARIFEKFNNPEDLDLAKDDGKQSQYWGSLQSINQQMHI